MATPRLRRRVIALCAVACAGIAAAGCGGTTGDEPAAVAPGATTRPPAAAVATNAGRGPSLLRGSVRLIDGDPLPLPRLRGRVVLVVNTASRCGFTPQFEGLEALYRAERARGFTVVGFPSNDFRQELTGDGRIAHFCQLNYGVSFPMATRTHVTGSASNRLFAAIASRPAPAGGPPSWNFTKYLLDRSGRLVARFDSSVEPDSPELRATVDRLLGEPANL